jgi:putative SOS response-associated peptidase YedK
MCGRVVSALPRDYLSAYFEVHEAGAPELPPRYNVAPGAELYAVADTRSGRRLGTMQWGLVPPWASNPSEGPRPINARAETLLDRPSFAEALEHRRLCLIPVDGFYEWREGPDGKQPFLLSAPDGSPLALAGLWSRWSGDSGESLVTCAIVTTAANDDVAPLHDRMPAVVPRPSWVTWLDRGNVDVRAKLRLLAPAPAGSLVARKVSRRVNDARNDGPELLSA